MLTALYTSYIDEKKYTFFCKRIEVKITANTENVCLIAADIWYRKFATFSIVLFSVPMTPYQFASCNTVSIASTTHTFSYISIGKTGC